MHEVRTDIQNGSAQRSAPSTDADFIEAFRLMDELTALPLQHASTRCIWRPRPCSVPASLPPPTT